MHSHYGLSIGSEKAVWKGHALSTGDQGFFIILWAPAKWAKDTALRFDSSLETESIPPNPWRLLPTQYGVFSKLFSLFKNNVTSLLPEANRDRKPPASAARHSLPNTGLCCHNGMAPQIALSKHIFVQGKTG